MCIEGTYSTLGHWGPTVNVSLGHWEPTLNVSLGQWIPTVNVSLGQCEPTVYEYEGLLGKGTHIIHVSLGH